MQRSSNVNRRQSGSGRRVRSLLALLAVVFVVLASGGNKVRAAQTLTWVPSSPSTDANWQENGNWTGGNRYPGALPGTSTTDVAQFGSTTGLTTITVGTSTVSPLNIAQIFFTYSGSAGPSYTIGSPTDGGLILSTITLSSSDLTPNQTETVNSPITLKGTTNFDNNTPSADNETLVIGGTITNNTASTLGIQGSSGGTILLSGAINDGNGATSLTLLNTYASPLAVLSNANSYTGGTTISLGTLYVNNTSGSGTGTGSVTISGGILRGTGTFSGNLTSSTGTLYPGPSATTTGVLHAGGNVTLSSSAKFTVALTPNQTGTEGTDGDVLQLTNTTGVFSAAGATLQLVPLNFTGALSSPQTYVIVDATANSASGVDSTVFSNLTVEGSSHTYLYHSGGVTADVTFSSDEITVNLDSVPEPGGLGLLSLAGLMLRRRRRMLNG